jgi:hypothetical protein
MTSHFEDGHLALERSQATLYSVPICKVGWCLSPFYPRRLYDMRMECQSPDSGLNLQYDSGLPEAAKAKRNWVSALYGTDPSPASSEPFLSSCLSSFLHSLRSLQWPIPLRFFLIPTLPLIPSSRGDMTHVCTSPTSGYPPCPPSCT